MLWKQTKSQAPHDFPLILLLWILGGIDALALVAVVMPGAWIDFGHAVTGLGEFPAAPVAGYLARSASALCALHGLLLLFMSFDVRRYWPLIRFLALLSILHGALMAGVAWREGMPLWWALLEGPGFAATGLLVLVCQTHCDARASASTQVGEPERNERH